MRIQPPERLQLPAEFPVAQSVPELAAVAAAQRNWYFEVKRAIQESVDKLLRNRNKFVASAGTGGTAAILASGPVGAAAPFDWVEVVAPDGTLCVMPVWKKSKV